MFTDGHLTLAFRLRAILISVTEVDLLSFSYLVGIRLADFLLTLRMKTFSELSLSALLKSNLAKHGFVEPTPVQALSIEPAIAGHNLVATAQTGTGKTLAFVLPLIHLLQNEPKKSGVRALILIP